MCEDVCKVMKTFKVLRTVHSSLFEQNSCSLFELCSHVTSLIILGVNEKQKWQEPDVCLE